MPTEDGYLLDWEGESVLQEGRLWRVPLASSTSPWTKGAAELGVDIACVDDVDSTLALAGAIPNLAMALCRRLRTPSGGLFYDLDYGLDLREYLNLGVSESRAASLSDEIRIEVEKDPRVQSAAVRLLHNRPANSMAVTIAVQTSVGPFTLSVAVSALTVKLLRVEARA